MSKLEEMAEMSYEAYIPISSTKIIGETFAEIEKKFAIKFIHYHNSPIEDSTRKNTSGDVRISAGMYIKVIGKWD
jgi:hypothetical protein